MEKNKLSSSELQQLHSNDYVTTFDESQDLDRISRLLKHINPSKKDRLIDIGCGSGLILPIIHKKIKQYVGIDFSEQFIALAKKKQKMYGIDNASFLCDNICDYASKEERKFQIALALDISEHVYDEDWLRILKSIYQLLEINGKFYLHTPNLDFFIEQMKARNILLKQFPEHIAVRNPENNIALLRLAGFNQIKIHYLPHYNVLKYFDLVSKLPIIGKYFRARLLIEATKL